MLDFYDVPSSPAFPGIGTPLKPVPLPPADLGILASAFADAKNLITTGWDNWFEGLGKLAPPKQIKVDITDVAGALTADAYAAMPFDACLTYCNLYLNETGSPQILAAKAWMSILPPHQRGAADAVLGVALSLATAAEQGYVYFASRTDMNDVLPKHLHIWVRRWEGNGPDYILDNGKGNISFYEVKSRATKCKKKPSKFSEYKAQSINADLMGLQQRYILSYAYLPAQTSKALSASVQWFNATGRPPNDGEEKRNPEKTYNYISIVIAFCQFRRILYNGGHTDLEMLRNNADPSEYGFNAKKNYWVERKPEGIPKLIIPNRVRICFRGIYDVLMRFRDTRDMKDLEMINFDHLKRGLINIQNIARHQSEDKLNNYEVLYVYANGIYVISEEK